MVMKFLISYRSNDGKQDQTVIEAESRNAVFSELEKRGMSAIRIEEANGKGSFASRRLRCKGSLPPLAKVSLPGL